MTVDGNNVLHRAYHKFRHLKGNGHSTSCIYGFPFILRSYITKFGPDKVIVVFDGRNKSKHRLEILPTYKERKKRLGFDYDDFIYQKEQVMDLLLAMGIPVVIHNEEEADDWIYKVYKEYRKNYDTLIVSSDKDFGQMINGSCSVYSPTKEMKLTPSSMFYKIGYYPKQTVDFLSLWGDSSDNIPGYPGIGEIKAKQFLEKFSSIRNFLNSKDTFGKVDKELLEAIYNKNRKLISLSYYYKLYLKNRIIPWYQQKGNPKINKRVLNEFGYNYEIQLFSDDNFIHTIKALKGENIRSSDI